MSDDRDTKEADDDVTTDGRDVDDVNGSENVAKNAKCGYRNCTPDCLQTCAKPGLLLTTLCLVVMVEAFVQWGLVNINMATWERRYNLQSTQSAWVVTSQDLTAAIVSPLLGYMSTFWEKTYMLSIAVVCMMVGSLLFLIPQLASGMYELGALTGGTTCPVGGNYSYDPCDEDISDTNLSYWLSIFVIAQIIYGYAGGCLWTVGITYIDDNCRQQDSPLYLGIFNAASALGGTLGFIGGGLALEVYVDVFRVDMDSIEIDSSDPRWVGAWWIGFLAAFVVSVPLVFLMPCFPPQLPAAAEYQQTRKSQVYKGKGEKETAREDFGRSCADLRESLKMVFGNPVFVLLSVAGIVEMGTVTAFAAFLPKIIQFQFGQTASMAALITGGALVPGSVLGQLLGGIFPKCLHFGLKGVLRMLITNAYLCVVFALAFLVRCQPAPLAGYTADYYYNSTLTYDDPFTHSCNDQCNCTTLVFEPICAIDGLSYFSPCYGGCTIEEEIDGKKRYGNCSCVENATTTLYQAEEDMCPVNCPEFWIFMPLLLLMIICTFIENTGGYAAVMRVVPEKQRAFAFGVQSPIIKFLGTVPFPIIFGLIFDLSCEVWQDNCGTQGSCWIYSQETLAFGMFLAAVIAKLISGTCFLASLLIYKPPPEPEVVEEVKDNHGKQETAELSSDEQTAEAMQNGVVYSGNVNKTYNEKYQTDTEYISTNNDQELYVTKL